ncbi:MAG: DUF309 domain-containing protein [Cyanobacteria bacterium J06627_8]
MTDNVSAPFWVGIEQFNQRQFYACHDTLEAIWMDANSSEKNFYQGILQIAVALYHLENLNWQGSVTLLGEGIYRLRAFSPSYEDIDVQELVTQSSRLLRVIQEAGRDGVQAIAQQLDDRNSPLSYPIVHRLS